MQSAQDLRSMFLFLFFEGNSFRFYILCFEGSGLRDFCKATMGVPHRKGTIGQSQTPIVVLF